MRREEYMAYSKAKIPRKQKETLIDVIMQLDEMMNILASIKTKIENLLEFSIDFD